MLNWLRHAFALETSVAPIPNERQAATIDTLCREIIRRRMTLPAQMMLESSAPLHFVTGQMLRFVEPFLGVILNPADIRDFASFVERRGAVEYICRRIDELQKTDEAPLPDLGSKSSREATITSQPTFDSADASISDSTYDRGDDSPQSRKSSIDETH